jgi:hypothetical protein
MPSTHTDTFTRGSPHDSFSWLQTKLHSLKIDFAQLMEAKKFFFHAAASASIIGNGAERRANEERGKQKEVVKGRVVVK